MYVESSVCINKNLKVLTTILFYFHYYCLRIMTLELKPFVTTCPYKIILEFLLCPWRIKFTIGTHLWWFWTHWSWYYQHGCTHWGHLTSCRIKCFFFLVDWHRPIWCLHLMWVDINYVIFLKSAVSLCVKLLYWVKLRLLEKYYIHNKCAVSFAV